MSRIGKKPIPIGKAKIAVSGQKVTAEGPKGKLEFNVHPIVKVELVGSEVIVTRPNDDRQSKALHGLTRALVANMVTGVTDGFTKTLEIRGVGYKAELRGKEVALNLGFANQLKVAVPPSLTVAVQPGAAEVANRIVISGADRQQVGDFAAKIRKLASPSRTRARAFATRRSRQDQGRQGVRGFG
jgi:large subunit ribosomal protein L6